MTASRIAYAIFPALWGRAVARRGEPEIDYVQRAISAVPQPFRHARRQIGVDQKAHAAILHRNHLVPREPSRVGDSLANIFPLEIGYSARTSSMEAPSAI
jgi:hypothetical protein